MFKQPYFFKHNRGKAREIEKSKDDRNNSDM